MNCDRGLEDVYISEDGTLSLINGDHLYGFTVDGRQCSTNSVFLPGSRNFKVTLFSPGYMAGVTENPSDAPHLVQLLDYRCHLPAGAEEIGTESYPPHIHMLLEETWRYERHTGCLSLRPPGHEDRRTTAA